MLNISPVVNTVYTHSDSFHVDELAAISLLAKYWFKQPVADVNVIRTREPAILDKAKSGNDFVIDVGREYSKEKLNFDHHQVDKNLVWSDGTPFSSCGLITHWLAENSDTFIAEHDSVKSRLFDFAKAVDKTDNGVELWKESSFFLSYNHSYDEQVQEMQFKKALSAMEGYIDNLLFRENERVRARDILPVLEKESIKNGHPQVLIIEEPISGTEARLYGIDTKAQWIATKFEKEWVIKNIPNDKNDLMSSKCNMPAAWRGLENEELQKVSGFNLRFCHKGGFICVLVDTKEKVIELTERMLELS